MGRAFTQCALLLAILLVPQSLLLANDLKQETLKAWDDYIQQADAKMKQRIAGGAATFFWMDEAPGRRELVRQGEILVDPTSNDIPAKVPQGLIHDWMGAVFIPNVTMSEVFAMLNDYSQYDRYFKPAVIDAKLLGVDGTTRRFSMLLAEKVPFVTAAIDSEYTAQTFRVDDRHWYTVTRSTRIQQIDNYGLATQHTLPPDQGDGFVWRLYSIQRFEENDGGVYTELEAIALSRNVPFELQWLIKPILRHMPRNSMTATLQKTRAAICSPDGSTGTEQARSASSTGRDATSGRDRRGSESAPTDPAERSFGFHFQK